MRIKRIHMRSYRRFSDLTITDLPEAARLVVMTGPNGSGKSSLFDAFNAWLFWNAFQVGYDTPYHQKQGAPALGLTDAVSIEFHSGIRGGDEVAKKAFYIRSAYRNEPDFTVQGLQRVRSPLDSGPEVQRMIDNDIQVATNYQRLVASTLEGIYGGSFDGMDVRELREHYIGQIRASMRSVFGDLVLKGPGDPMGGGTFYFEKGISQDFQYKNLSGGEKAAFDILLDLVAKRSFYDDTVYCIDEPELHMHTRLQARLLEELVQIIPERCQLWIATHAIGMMRAARDLQGRNPDQVAFLDFHDRNFDEPVTLRPVSVDRHFWSRTLDVALGDLADLVAPRRVVLCEGRPVGPGDTAKAEFDARCFRTIFASEYPDTDFISVGNESDVRTDRLEIGKAIQTLVSGTTVIRVVDQDDRSPQEIADLRREGVRVLSRRHLEAYLLDDEVLARLCQKVGVPAKETEVLAAKAQALSASAARGNPPDDVKSPSGQIYVYTKRILRLTQHGNTAEAFMRDALAPLVVPGMSIYSELKNDIFGE